MDTRSKVKRTASESNGDGLEPRARAAFARVAAASRSVTFPLLSVRPLLPSVPQSPLSRQITRHTMPSNFRPKSLKTNDGGMHEVSHFFGVACDGPATNLALNEHRKYEELNARREIPLRAKCALSRDDNPYRIVTNLLSFREAPKMARLMTSVLDIGNFLTPGAPCWAFAFMGARIHG
jgi:hypothetical protein